VIMRARGLVYPSALLASVLVCAAFSSVASGAAGDLDPTFSGDGKQTTDMPLGSSRAAATAIQPDGRVVVVGRDFAHGGGSAVARLVGLLNRGHRLGRQERVSCVEYRGFGLPQWAPSVEFTEGYLYDRPIGPRSST